MLVFDTPTAPASSAPSAASSATNNINIAGMQVSRQGDRAIGVLSVDSAVPAGLAAGLAEVVEAKIFTAVDLQDD